MICSATENICKQLCGSFVSICTANEPQGKKNLFDSLVTETDFLEIPKVKLLYIYVPPKTGIICI